MSDNNSSIVMNWQLSSYFGWGVYGIQLMVNWSRQHNTLMLTGLAVDESLIDLNPIEWAMIRPAVDASRELHERFAPLRGQQVAINRPVLQPLSDDFFSTGRGAHDVELCGKPNLGITFFEQTLFSAQGRERAKSYPLIVAGSSWNHMMLEQERLGLNALVFQGVDPTAFHPAPKAGWFNGRFSVFSGGKLEYRKGQDLLLKAFHIFADRHSDALLVTAWASPWPSVARSLDADPTLRPVSFLADGRVDVAAWLRANGIRPEQFIDLGAVPNAALPRLYREMDVGVFPNRSEGGTNLVAMECMACGVPVILSRNTGHLDLIGADRCFVLERQAPIEGANHVGWGESDVEEIVETLEAVYRDRACCRSRGERGAAFMRGMTWSDTVRQLTQALEPFL